MQTTTQNYILYAVTSFIWGSTWYAIHLQLGTVPAMWSIVYRFTLAGFILLVYCLFRRMNLRFSRRQHFFIALQGLLLFSINYILYYFASEYLVSGMLALIFALIVVMNIINCRIFFKTPITLGVVGASVLGFVGLGCVFWSQTGEWLAQSQSHGGLHGLLLGIGFGVSGIVIASLGNIAAVYNKKLGVPIVVSNALGILYGALFTLLFALISGQAPIFDTSWSYLLSLAYLTIAGTIVAFGTYLMLISRIGADKGAYVFVSTPIVALLLSTFYEDFHWSLLTILGVLAVIGGNLLVLKRGEEAPQVVIPAITQYAQVNRSSQ